MYTRGAASSPALDALGAHVERFGKVGKAASWSHRKRRREGVGIRAAPRDWAQALTSVDRCSLLSAATRVAWSSVAQTRRAFDEERAFDLRGGGAPEGEEAPLQAALGADLHVFAERPQEPEGDQCQHAQHKKGDAAVPVRAARFQRRRSPAPLGGTV
eukprot:583526-Pyramimonas_sp.AAC.2